MKNELSVDVLLTAYKKLDVLQIQIDAIRRQTYKINKLFLFKDGVESYYDIVLKDSILNQFDDVFIADRNYGVWERFEYALNICESECVCIFDDDTIPGDEWIENCVQNYMNRRGVYGTNGVIALNKYSYPYEMLNVGWHNPNSITMQVDFVGHAWFLKTTWIEWMLEFRDKLSCKHVGEDMALSYACQIHGVNTYVPEHPYNNVKKWGSKPNYGVKFGTQSTALSLNLNNLHLMNEVFVRMCKEGWHLISEKKISYEGFEGVVTKKKVILDDFERFVNKYDETYIYGAGKYGKAIYRFLKMNGISVNGFAVTNCDEKKVDVNNEKVQVISLKELNSKRNVGTILGLSNVYHNSVKSGLHGNVSLFMSDETTYSYDDVIEMVFEFEIKC